MMKPGKKLSVFIAAMVMLQACLAFGAMSLANAGEGGDYQDIKGHWAEESINMLIAGGYVKGIMVDGRLEIQPGKNVTRAEFITLLSRCRKFDLIEENVKQFNDVKSDAWYKADLDKLSSNSIVKGSTDGAFHPESPITRAEIAALICRAYGWETAENMEKISTIEQFTDVSPEAWYYQSVMIDRMMKAINGNPDGSFAPLRNATRAEAMTILANLISMSDGSQPGSSPAPGATPGVQPGPTPSPTPEPAPVYNPSGLIAYDIKAEFGKSVYYQINSFGMKELDRFEIKVNYDPEFVRPVNVIKGSLMFGDYLDSVDFGTADQGYIIVSSRSGSGSANDSGTIFTVVFELMENASGGTGITLTGSGSDLPELYDVKGNRIDPLSVKQGSINLK